MRQFFLAGVHTAFTAVVTAQRYFCSDELDSNHCRERSLFLGYGNFLRTAGRHVRPEQGCRAAHCRLFQAD